MSGASFLESLHKRLLRDTLGQTQRRNIVRLIAPIVPDGDTSILDIGCGDGTFSHMLMSGKPNLRVTGVETVMRSSSFIPQCSYDGITLPFRDKSFDFAMLINVLHHVDDPQKTLLEAIRVSKHGIIIKDHYANTRFDFYNLVLMEIVGNAFRGINQPHHFLSKKEWEELFEKVRLKPEKLLTRFVSYNRVVDIFCGRNLHFIAKLTAY